MQDKDSAMAMRSTFLMNWLWATRTMSYIKGLCLPIADQTISRNVEWITR